jgi:gliding motility-associated-like protein
MNRAGLLILILYASINVYGQGENNIWAFGINAGIDFNSGSPVCFASKSKTSEGCATISKPDGSLLFYSDGNRVFDKNQTLMPNAKGLLGNTGGAANNYGSSTQGVAIVPFINDSNKYYLFTLDCAEGIYDYPGYRGYLRYSVIDITLNNGLGDVVAGEKNRVIDSNKSEKMMVVKGSGCFFWLLTHQYGTSEFRAYKINSAGISAPVSSFACSFDTNLLQPMQSYMGGEMKISSDNKLIANVNGSPVCVEVFSFDDKWGTVSAPSLIYQPQAKLFLYGISFSPDNSKLYIGQGDGLGTVPYRLFQADISLMPDVAQVTQSITEVGDSSTWSGMRIGPDGKIYIAGYNSNLLHCIQYPNLKGDACTVLPLRFSVDDTIHFQLGFGNAVYAVSELKPRPKITGAYLCDMQRQKALLYADEAYEKYKWYDGSTKEYITPDSAGVYWVEGTNECGTATDTFVVKNNCTACAYLPTAFTPNNDGVNDCFKPVGDNIVVDVFKVFDRWGKNVFSSANGNFCWYGTYKDALCEMGTYYYFVKGKCRDGKNFSQKGDVTLLK